MRSPRISGATRRTYGFYPIAGLVLCAHAALTHTPGQTMHAQRALSAELPIVGVLFALMLIGFEHFNV
jgi:hypothetical protein